MMMTLMYIYLTSIIYKSLDATATGVWEAGPLILNSPKTLFIYGFTIQLHTHPPTYNYHAMHAVNIIILMWFVKNSLDIYSYM